MRLFNKGNHQRDERVESMMNKVYKEAYFMAIAICFVSIVVKFYLYGFNFDNVITEFLIIIIPGLYYTVRIVGLGIYSDEVEVHDRGNKFSWSTKRIMWGLASGVGISTFFGIRSAILYGNGENTLWYFILVFFAAFIIYVPFLVAILAISHVMAKRASEKANSKDGEE